MANHIRQQLRERAGTVLTGLTTTGSNVFETRIYPLENTNLPALVIYTKNETSEPLVISTNRLMSRELELIVEVYVKQTSNFDDQVDKICKEVEVAISADTTLNGLAKDCFLQSTEIEYNTEGEQPLSYAVLTFLTNYYVQETAPDVAV
nr:Phage minor tail protein U [uncultured Mediterranean phage uvMED]BAR29189.1 Phage minor tail protein U [uncultured Mediterranean phage uvMED]